MVNGIKEGDFVVAKSGGVRYVSMDNGNGITFTDDGLVSGVEPSTRCYYKYYSVLDRRVVFSERFRLMDLMMTGVVMPYCIELPFIGWLRMLR